MDNTPSFHMSPEEFRRWGHAMVDWLAAYQERVESMPVQCPVKPGQIRASLPAQPPLHGEPFETILADVERLILPGITHWQSPNFFAFFPANNSGPSILGELLSAGLGVQGMLWATSPACTELETLMLDWMADMAGLPARFKSGARGGGVIQDSASSAVLCALLAARERATGFQTNETGCTGRLVAYTSPHAHSSVEKAVKIAGLGRGNLRFIEADDHCAMRPEALARQIARDRQAGLLPCFVSATAGTTSSNGFDPLPDLGRICREHNLWLHVDGAMAGAAALCPEFRHLFEGLELADSYAFNPHKWMFTNFDCDCFYVADRAALIKTLSVLPEYLRNQATDSGAVIDYRDWQVPLGRRFRALKLWFVIRHYGLQGLQYHIRRHVELARQFASWVAASPDFQLLAPAPLNLVCFAHRAGDEFNRLLLDRLNAEGRLYMTHTVLNGRYTLRFCVGQTHTEAAHVRGAWERIQAAAKALSDGWNRAAGGAEKA
jgi:aromatic-L-amino-acid decarboxylase